MNNHFGINNQNPNFFWQYDENEKTVAKVDKKVAWTPEKRKNFKENLSFADNDTTLTGISLGTTNNKLHTSMSIDTPIKNKKPSSELYEASIRTPIKKTKKRDCTPAYSEGEEERENSCSDQSFKNNYGYNFPMENDCTRNIQFNNINSYMAQTNTFPNYINNYNLLKLHPKNQISNFDNKLNRLNSGINDTNNNRFQKISKSKFLQKIDELENNTSDGVKISTRELESDEIKDKIRGNYLLYLLENENNKNCENLFYSIIEDNDLFNKITNLICYAFFDGFNNRSDIFFKFLSPVIYLEIVDQPLNSFENSLAILTNHILTLDAFYDNCQIDFLPEEMKYIFSLRGTAILNTPNRDILNFIVSLRICLNLNDENKIRCDSARLEEIVNIDFVKIKIFPDN